MINLEKRYETASHQKLLDTCYKTNNKLGFSIVDNVCLIPFIQKGKSGGVYTLEGKLIPETSTNKEYGLEVIPNIILENINNSYDELCIYMGVYEPCWGHFITDCLKKMWFLKTKSFEQFKECSLIFLSEKKDCLGKNHKRLLEVAGVDTSKIIICNKAARARKVLIPDSSFFYDDSSTIHYTKEFIETIDSIKEQFKDDHKKQYEKIYYSYSSYQKKKGYKKTFGEEKLDIFFKDMGFLIVHPECHSLDEQMEMLANCKCFASTEGSSSHNSIFLKDGAEVIIIPRGPYFSGYQQTIDSIGELNIHYIDSSLTAFPSKSGPWSGPNYFYVSDELMDYFHLSNKQKQQYIKKNFKDLKKYVAYNFVNLSGRHYYIQNIYAEKFFYYLGLNSKKVFPGMYLKMKISNFFEKIKRGKTHG